MSDFSSQLPVRSVQDIDQRVLTKIQDGQNPDAADGTARVTNEKLHVTIHQGDGSQITEEMPLPVSVTESAGDEIISYDESVDVASSGSMNHDYSVSATKTLKVLDVEASASGKARFELQIETSAGSGTFETKGVKFNSTANPNVQFKLSRFPRVEQNVTIRIVKTNLDEQPQSIYSTLNGVEV